MRTTRTCPISSTRPTPRVRISAVSWPSSDRKLLDFADIFEDRIVRQGIDEDRSIEETLDIAWEIFTELDLDQLTRISRKYLDKYLPKK